MFDRKKLKERAKLVLLRSYSKVFLACIAVNLLSGGGFGISARRLRDMDFTSMPPEKMIMVFAIIVILSIIAVALSIFVVSPLEVGLKRFMTENADSDAPLDLLLSPFNDEYKNTVIVQFMKNLFIFLWSLPAVIPTVVVSIFSDSFIPLFEQVSQGSVLAASKALGIVFIWIAVTLVFAVPSIIKELQYVMVPYILADDPAANWRRALSESKEMMVGNKWAYIKLILSFVLWYIAANILCCVGGFLVIPYVEATVCELYLELSGKTTVSAEYGE